MTCQQCTTTANDANLGNMTDHLCVLTPLSSLSWEANSSSASHKTTCISCNLPLKEPTMCAWPQTYQSSPRTPLPPGISWRNILILFSHVSLGLPSSLFPSGCHQNPVCPSPLPHLCYMHCPSQYDYNEQFLVRSTDHAAPHYSISSIPLLPHPCHPKYSPQHPILKHPQPMLLAPLSMSQTKSDTHLFAQAG